MHRLTFCSVLATLALGLAACGSTPPSRSGAAVEPITLSATSYEQKGRIGTETLARFVQSASELSDGAIKITVGPDPDNADPDTSAAKIAEIRNGTYDLGIVAARSFDRLGVDSFQALQAPLLVTSNELAERILADPLAVEMLGGLDRIGLQGLGLTFAERRFVVGFKKALASPADFSGAVVAARPSKATYATLRALGAKPSPVNGGELSAAAADGSIVGSEGVVGTNSPVHPVTVTANEPLYLKANVLVVNRAVFGGLSDAQQDVLRTAAANAATWAAAQHPDDAEGARRYCADGNGSVALATRAQLATLRALTAPVIARMGHDPLTRRTIARIHALAADIPAPVVAACTMAASPTLATTPASGTTVSATGDQSLLNGTWRINATAENIEAAGAPTDWAGANAGVWTLHLKDGKGAIDQPQGDPCIVSYTLDGEHMSFNFAAEPASGCGGVLRGTVHIDGDTATFHWDHQDEVGGNPVAWDNGFWKGGMHRIGGAP